MKSSNNKQYLSVKELADILHVSRITVFNRIKNGQIKAEKVGRNYIILKDNIKDIVRGELSDKLKKEIERGVKKVVDEYGDTLKLLGKE